MLLFCEECGERYSFSLEDIDSKKNSFTCGKCGFVIKLVHGEELKRKIEAADKMKEEGEAKSDLFDLL